VLNRHDIPSALRAASPTDWGTFYS
jgi:hypothetical protein